jgi:transposase-like protein
MADITPEQLAIIRKRWEDGERQTDLAREYGVRQSELSELLSGRSGGRRAPRLTDEQKQELVAKSAGGASIDALAEHYSQTPIGVSRILRAHGWDRDDPGIVPYPIPSDGSPGTIWKDAFEIRWNKRAKQGVVRCTPAYRSNGTEPKMLPNGRVRLRVHGPDPGDTTTYVQHTFQLDDLIRAARRNQQLIAAEGKPWFTYFMLRKGVFTPTSTKGGIAAAGEGALVEKVKIGATKGQAEDRVAADTFHPEPLYIVCVVPGWDRDKWHGMFASYRCRNSGPGNEWFEAVGDVREFLIANVDKRADKEPGA